MNDSVDTRQCIWKRLRLGRVALDKLRTVRRIGGETSAGASEIAYQSTWTLAVLYQLLDDVAAHEAIRTCNEDHIASSPWVLQRTWHIRTDAPELHAHGVHVLRRRAHPT
ncbi:MAG TPA: hypothetical protein VF510_14500 [Ktedonobacterales bacterium]